jgi:peptidoglycan/xylan/chitin deacetylase (PgdA/CDA1 family)
LFVRHVKEIKKRYNLVSLQDYLQARENAGFKLPKKSLVITFDDAHKNNYRLLPFIKEQEIPVSVFICSSIVNSKKHFWFLLPLTRTEFDNLRKMSDEKRITALKAIGFEEDKEFETRQALNKDEIKEMSDYIDFQSHTRYHPFLPECTLARAEREIKGSKNELEQEFGLQINSLSYPNGDYSEREIELTKKAGYKLGITVDLGFNSLRTDPFKLKRICINDKADTFDLLLQTCGMWQFFKNLLKQ